MQKIGFDAAENESSKVWLECLPGDTGLLGYWAPLPSNKQHCDFDDPLGNFDCAKNCWVLLVDLRSRYSLRLRMRCEPIIASRCLHFPVHSEDVAEIKVAP